MAFRTTSQTLLYCTVPYYGGRSNDAGVALTTSTPTRRTINIAMPQGRAVSLKNNISHVNVDASQE
eukprot:scaffold5588_cov180-Amphora_coffeaeformis.AAC.3